MRQTNSFVPVTFRAIIIAIIGIVIICAISPYNNYLTGAAWIAADQFSIGVIALLSIVVLILNVIWRKLSPRSALTTGELVTIWCMMAIMASFPASAFVRYFHGPIASIKYLATPENEWESLLQPNVPKWMFISDARAAKYFYEGLPTGIPIDWGAWIKPITFWSSFMLIMFFMMAFLACIFRKEWIENERLAFPLVQLPLEMSRQPEGRSLLNSFFKNRMLLVGLAIPVFLHTLNGFHRFFPAVPGFRLWFFNMDPYLNEKPWSAARPLPFNFFPSMIGFAYFINLDVAMSLWVFAILRRLELVGASAFGRDLGRVHESIGYEEMGCQVVLVFFFLWIGKTHFKKYIKSVFSGKSKRDPNEPLSPRWAFFGFIVTLLAGTFMLWAGGANFSIVLGVLISFCITCIVMTWLVVHGGMPFLHGYFRSDQVAHVILGTSRVGPKTMTILAIPGSMLFRDMREFIMPNVMNSLKLSNSTKLNPKHLLMVLFLAMLIAAPLSLYFDLQLLHKEGAQNSGGLAWANSGHLSTLSLKEISSYIQNPRDVNWSGIISMGIGGVVMGFLLFMSYQCLWWPLHPLGFAASPIGWAMRVIWFSMFLGWLCKFVIIKSGGLGLYRKARPVFLGLILGDCIMGGIWSTVGFIIGRTYNVLPI